MTIIIEPHTLIRAKERGTNAEEIKDTIEFGMNIIAKKDRFAKAKVYDFNSIWNNKFYKQKRVEVIYTIVNDLIVTITVYVFYGKWSKNEH
jgi:hypothetical protein